MTQKLSGDKELTEAIIPKNFGVGCRRPTVSPLLLLRGDVVQSNTLASSLAMDSSRL